MPFSLQIASQPIGRARGLYACKDVAKEVLHRNRNTGGLANDYQHYGTAAGTPAAGTVVVGCQRRK